MVRINYILLSLAACLVVVVQISCSNDISELNSRSWPSDQWEAFYNAEAMGGFKDQDGRIVIPAKYDEVLDFRQGRGFVLTGGKWYVINESGDIVGDNTFYDVRPFCAGLAAVYVKSEDDILCAYIDRKGQYVVEPIYKGIISNYDGNYGRIQNPTEVLFFNSSGDIVANYLDCGALRDGLRL